MGICRILNVSQVLIPPGPYPAPGETIQLSLLDSQWVSLPHIQRVFLYPDTNIPFASIVASLKSSLTRILPFFHPIAGKLTYVPSTRNVIIDCSVAAVKEGVTFVEAESDIDIRRIAGEELHDHESFKQLVPDISVVELPASVLAVQVTRFSSGGVSIGLSKHHSLSDGKGLWIFIEAWAATSLAGHTPPQPIPVHDRSIITHPGFDEIAKDFLVKVYPDLPKILSPKNPIQERVHLIHRTFTIDSSMIKLLKEKAIHEKPSTFVALSAHALASIANARRLDKDNNPLVAIIPVDCRSLLKPPIVEGYTGNCILPLRAGFCGLEIAGPDGFVRACALIKEAIQRATVEPLARCKEWADEFMKRPPAGGMVFFYGSPHFKGYNTDFGWGNPARVELTSMNNDGIVAMLRGKDEGMIQVSVALSGQHMDEFARVFIIN